MEEKKYCRDGRSPKPKDENVSKVMSSNKGKNTKPELKLRKKLREIGLPGYRIHWKKAPGKPDIAFPKYKIAIFVNGCFWHRCPYCNLSLPKSNVEFWKAKFENNKKRDKLKIQNLKKEDWEVFVFWECQITESVETCAMQIKNFIDKKISPADEKEKRLLKVVMNS